MSSLIPDTFLFNRGNVNHFLDQVAVLVLTTENYSVFRKVEDNYIRASNPRVVEAHVHIVLFLTPL